MSKCGLTLASRKYAALVVNKFYWQYVLFKSTLMYVEPVLFLMLFEF